MPATATVTKIYVLFASQTGNSEQAAQFITDNMAKHLSGIEAETMQLDDFLELKQAPWSSVVIICMSSYGVGQAPLGGYRFRDFCDYMLKKEKSGMLSGIQFALLGFGDSKFTTFFQNPTTTNKALEYAGAKRICDIGKVDASKKNDVETSRAWIAQLWAPLEKAVKASSVKQEALDQMQTETIEIMREINPDFVKLHGTGKQDFMYKYYGVASLLFALLAMGMAWYANALQRREQEGADEF